jgi:hypothetical protein
MRTNRRLAWLPLLIIISITTTVFTLVGLAFGARLGARYVTERPLSGLRGSHSDGCPDIRT